MVGATGSEVTTSTELTIADFRAEYAQADIFCQKVQDFIREAGIPAMNELRNAGHHLLKSLDDSGNVSNQAELIRAVNHAKRACYEAGEAGILIALDEIHAFKEEFRGIRIGEAVPSYVAMMSEAQKARETILDSRTNGEDRSGDHKVRMEAFETLRDICRTLDVARPECQAVARSAVQDGRRFVIGLTITIALAFVGWAFFS